MSHPSDDEEDYMSDAFLLKCEDKRPGLSYSSKTAKEIERERKQKEYNEKNRFKPKKVLEHEKRVEGLSTALSTNNKGFSLLQKMGYKPGMTLGKRGTGRAEPVPFEIKLGRGGLGEAAETKRKAARVQVMWANRATKRRRVEANLKESFQQQMSSRFASKTVGKDLKTSQTACHQLDAESGCEKPEERFYWPDSWWRKDEKPEEDEEEDEDEDKDKEKSEEDGEEEENKEKSEEEDGAEEEEDEGQPLLTDEEKLQALTLYLRTTYFYCIWCGTKYDDGDDMGTDCPGDTAEMHD